MSAFFTPTYEPDTEEVPYWEDVRSQDAPYYRVATSANIDKRITQAKSEVSLEIGLLGGAVTGIQQGRYDMAGGVSRYGYRIQFSLGGLPGALSIAGLPLRSETEIRIKHTLLQALLNTRDQFKAVRTHRLFSPGSNPLLQYLLVDGERTFAEYLRDEQQTPQLGVGRWSDEIVDGRLLAEG